LYFMVLLLVFSAVAAGHLHSESPLTAKDIKKIEQSFLKTLSAQYHERVEYPPLEEKTSEQQV